MSVARRMQMGAAGVSSGGGGSDGDFTSANYVSSYTIPVFTNLRGASVSDDETKLLTIDVSGATSYLVRIELSTGGDLSTASVADSSSIGSGTKSSLFLQSPSIFWAVDSSADTIQKYTLDADFGNTVSSTETTSVPAGANPVGSDNPNSVTFNGDGSKMFIGDFDADGVQEFTLSTNYDPSTETYVDNGDVSSQTTTPFQHAWGSNGTKLYVIETGAGSSKLFQYSLSVAYDVSTKSYDGLLSLDGGPLATSGYALGIVVSADGSSLYVSGADFSNDFSFFVKYSAV